jgi:hypothetical protein
MKKQILNSVSILAAGILTSQFSIAQSNKSIELKLKSATNFEFLHCKPSETKSTDLVVHYIIDIQNNNINQLYVTSGLSIVKGKNLKKLTSIETQFTEINAEVNSDMSFVSAKNDLKFKLVIQDTDGQYLSGNIYQKHQTVPVVCKDVAIE